VSLPTNMMGSGKMTSKEARYNIYYSNANNTFKYKRNR
jgi:hypothetical protein